ncbi:MAG: MFS transporter [Clostridia bacterium]|nr:MFS transporter [Clostridia bacterium]
MVRLCARLKLHYAWAILVGCFILSLGGTAIVVNCIGVFIKPVSEAMGFSRASFSLFYTFSTLVSTCMAPFLGSIIKKVGSKLPVIVCSIGAGVMLFCYSFCRELYQFYLCGCLAGIFTGALTSMAISTIIYRWFEKKRGMAIGIAFAGSGLGSMVLNPLVTHIIETVGWQAGFQLLGVLLIAVNVTAALVFIIDHPGKIGLKPLGAEEGASQVKKASLLNICRKDAMKLPQFWVLCVASALAGLLGTGIQQHLNAYMTDIGYTPAYAATIFSTVMFLLTVGKLLLGVVIDRFGTKAGTAIICSLLSLSSFVLLFSGQGWMPMVFAVIFGGGYTILSILPTTLTSSLMGTADYSANYGVVTFFLCSGMAVGSPISAFFFDTFGSYKPAWILYGVMAVVVLVMYLWAIGRFEKMRRAANP